MVILLQIFFFSFSVKIALFFKKQSKNIFKQIIETKLYLYGFAIIPYTVAVILSMYLNIMEDSDLNKIKIFYEYISLFLLVLLLYSDIKGVSLSCDVKFILLFFIYLPFSFGFFFILNQISPILAPN